MVSEMTQHGEGVDPDTGSIERGLASVVVGLVAASLVIIGLGPVFQRFYPVPEFNPLRAAQQLQEVSDALRPGSFLLLLGAYALSSLVGGLASTLTSGRSKSWPALITGVSSNDSRDLRIAGRIPAPLVQGCEPPHLPHGLRRLPGPPEVVLRGVR